MIYTISISVVALVEVIANIDYSILIVNCSPRKTTCIVQQDNNTKESFKLIMQNDKNTKKKNHV